MRTFDAVQLRQLRALMHNLLLRRICQAPWPQNAAWRPIFARTGTAMTSNLAKASRRLARTPQTPIIVQEARCQPKKPVCDQPVLPFVAPEARQRDFECAESAQLASQ
eukprot:6182604-Pleurochrysis_carterae.AAC.2